jgi:hypothetical protein
LSSHGGELYHNPFSLKAIARTKALLISENRPLHTHPL